MEIRPLKMSDLDACDLENKGLFKKTITMDNSYTVTNDDGHIVFCAGLAVLWQGVAEVWLCIADDSQPVALVLAARRLLIDTITKFGLWRLHAIVREDNIKAQKFMTVLGFDKGETMKKFNSDRTNAIMYSLVM